MQNKFNFATVLKHNTYTMKQLLKKLFLLLNLIALAFPLSAEDYVHLVAGTDFEPIEGKSHPFYLHEYENNGTNCDSLAFYNSDVFPQDIIVCNNKKYKDAGKLIYINQGYNVGEFGYKAAKRTKSNKCNVALNEYIVTTPGELNGSNVVGGLSVSQDSKVKEKGMFITKTGNPSNKDATPTECLFHYRIDNLDLKKDSKFQLAIGFVNLSTVNSGDLSYKLVYFVHGVDSNGEMKRLNNSGSNEWYLNSGQSKELTMERAGFNVATKYSSIIVTVIVQETKKDHILGIDYINIYSEHNIIDNPDAPSNNGYNECPTDKHTKKYYKELINADLTKGYLSFYEDANKTRPISKDGFYTDEVQTETVYYTYTDNATSKKSKVGKLTITVKPNPTITLSSSIKDNEIVKCNAMSMDVAAGATVEGSTISELKWSLAAGAPEGVTISDTDNTGKATVSFANDGKCIFGTAKAILTATAANGCSTTNDANPVILTNNNCAELKLESSVSDSEECEGNEITYTFTLKNQMGYTSEDIDVTLVFPESGFTMTSTTPSLSNNKWHIEKLEHNKETKLTIKGTAQVSESKVSEDFTITAYVSRVGESTFEKENATVKTEPKVKVYNTASTPALDMEGLTSIEQCNDGNFEIKAEAPAIGSGNWSFVEIQSDDVRIETPTSNITKVTGVPLGETVAVRWTVTNGECVDTDNNVEVKLTNKDCTNISISGEANSTTVCEGAEVSYTFKLENNTGVESENIKVKFEFPEGLTLLEENPITSTKGNYALNDDGTYSWVIAKMSVTDTPTLTIKGTVEVLDDTKEFQEIGVKGIIYEVAKQTLDPAPTAKSTVKVYNTASVPALDLGTLTSIAQCNNGEFTIKAAKPTIGDGVWSFASAQPGGASIETPSSNVTKVTGVPLGEKVVVRWTVTNGDCKDAENYVDLELINNNCTTFEPSVDDAEVATCYGTDATFTFTVKNTATVAVKNVKLSLSLESGLALQKASVGDIQFDENNQYVIPTMDSYETVTITVVATATVDKAKATISVIESSGVTVNGVSVSKPVTVYDLPEVSFTKPSSIICIDDLDKEETKVQVNFTKGKPNFEISYTIGENSFTDNVEENTHSIEKSINVDATISIDKVVDFYGCTATDFGAIKHEVETKTHATLGKLNELADTCEGATLSLTAPGVTNNGSTVSNQKWVLNEKDFAPTTKLDFDAHNGKSIYYQVTSSCNGKIRDIKTEPVTISVINSDVSFELAIDGDNVLIAGEKAKVTVVPNEKEAETYRWVANGNELSVSGLEFYDYLYLDTKFEVKAIGSCGTATNTTDIEVIWPTAFTPHNQNGLNDTFAKGMKIMVFNRFYTKIFEGNDGWDGTINGSLNDKTDIAVPGVYYYSVLFPNGDVRKGTIEIIKVD